MNIQNKDAKMLISESIYLENQLRRCHEHQRHAMVVVAIEFKIPIYQTPAHPGGGAQQYKCVSGQSVTQLRLA